MLEKKFGVNHPALLPIPLTRVLIDILHLQLRICERFLLCFGRSWLLKASPADRFSFFSFSSIFFPFKFFLFFFFFAVAQKKLSNSTTSLKIAEFRLWNWMKNQVCLKWRHCTLEMQSHIWKLRCLSWWPHLGLLRVVLGIYFASAWKSCGAGRSAKNKWRLLALCDLFFRDQLQRNFFKIASRDPSRTILCSGPRLVSGAHKFGSFQRKCHSLHSYYDCSCSFAADDPPQSCNLFPTRSGALDGKTASHLFATHKQADFKVKGIACRAKASHVNRKNLAPPHHSGSKKHEGQSNEEWQRKAEEEELERRISLSSTKLNKKNILIILLFVLISEMSTTACLCEVFLNGSKSCTLAIPTLVKRKMLQCDLDHANIGNFCLQNSDLFEITKHTLCQVNQSRGWGDMNLGASIPEELGSNRNHFLLSPHGDWGVWKKNFDSFDPTIVRKWMLNCFPRGEPFLHLFSEETESFSKDILNGVFCHCWTKKKKKISSLKVKWCHFGKEKETSGKRVGLEGRFWMDLLEANSKFEGN